MNKKILILSIFIVAATAVAVFYTGNTKNLASLVLASGSSSSSSGGSGCTSDQNCTAGNHCDTTTTPHQCVANGSSSSSSSGGVLFDCSDYCENDSQCTLPGQVCDTNMNKCVYRVATCNSNNDCYNGLICDNDGHCVTGCTPMASNGCLSGSTCNSDGVSCLQNTDCSQEIGHIENIFAGGNIWDCFDLASLATTLSQNTPGVTNECLNADLAAINKQLEQCQQSQLCKPTTPAGYHYCPPKWVYADGRIAPIIPYPEPATWFCPGTPGISCDMWYVPGHFSQPFAPQDWLDSERCHLY